MNKLLLHLCGAVVASILTFVPELYAGNEFCTVDEAAQLGAACDQTADPGACCSAAKCTADCCLNTSDPGECACGERVSVDLFCKDDQTANLLVGCGVLDKRCPGFENVQFGIEFQAIFPGAPPRKKMDLFFLDGLASLGDANDRKVTDVKCSPNGDGTATCRGIITLCEEQKLSEKFNTDQAVINIALRSKSRELCLGKFTNNAAKLETDTRLSRIYCGFTPASDPALQGEGYFDLRGYGNQGEAHLQMTFAGFEPDETFRGCVPGRKGFQEVLSFKSFGEDSSDATIYGTALDSESQAKLSNEPVDYSYDLLRAAQQEQNQSGLRIDFGGGALSSINYTVGSGSADRERSSSNSSSSSSAKRNSKRNRKNKGKRGNNRSLTSFVAAARREKPQQVFGWMGFDPLFQDVFIANTCGKNVGENNLGVVRCNSEQGGERRCVGYASAELDGEGNPLIQGNVCLEPRGPFTLLLGALDRSAAGEYKVCVGDTELNGTLVSADDGGVLFGEFQATDSAAVNSASPSIVLFEGDLKNITQVKVGREAGCADGLIEASL